MLPLAVHCIWRKESFEFGKIQSSGALDHDKTVESVRSFREGHGETGSVLSARL